MKLNFFFKSAPYREKSINRKKSSVSLLLLFYRIEKTLVFWLRSNPGLLKKKAPTGKCCAAAILSWTNLKKIFSVHFTEFRLISLLRQKKFPKSKQNGARSATLKIFRSAKRIARPKRAQTCERSEQIFSFKVFQLKSIISFYHQTLFPKGKSKNYNILDLDWKIAKQCLLSESKVFSCSGTRTVCFASGLFPEYEY